MPRKFCIYSCSVVKSCLTLCNPMDCSMPGFPVLSYLLEFAETHVHWVSNAIQPSHPLSPPSPPALYVRVCVCVCVCVGFPGGLMVKNLLTNAGDTGDLSSIARSGRFRWRRKWQPTPLLLPGKSHGQRSLASYSP